MPYNIILSDNFKKEFKKLLKKYPSLKKEGKKLITELKNDPKTGVNVGNNCYKIKLSIASKGRGKSGRARVITYVKIEKNTVFILYIYYKVEEDSIAASEIKSLLKPL